MHARPLHPMGACDRPASSRPEYCCGAPPAATLTQGRGGARRPRVSWNDAGRCARTSPRRLSPTRTTPPAPLALLWHGRFRQRADPPAALRVTRRRAGPQQPAGDGVPDRGQARPGRGPPCFPPLRRTQPPVLEEGVGDHGHERVAVRAGPRAALEVVEAELFLELLVRLLAHPARLAGDRQRLQVRVGRQSGEVILPLARVAGVPAARPRARRAHRPSAGTSAPRSSRSPAGAASAARPRPAARRASGADRPWRGSSRSAFFPHGPRRPASASATAELAADQGAEVAQQA